MTKEELQKMVEDAANETYKPLHPAWSGSENEAFKDGAQLIIDGPLADAEKRLNDIKLSANIEIDRFKEISESSHTDDEYYALQLENNKYRELNKLIESQNKRLMECIEQLMRDNRGIYYDEARQCLADVRKDENECKHQFGHYTNDLYEYCLICGERGELAAKERRDE